MLKVILAMVMSVDGKTTRGKDAKVHAWTSKEDQAYFMSLIQEQQLVIMGRKTYAAAKSQMRLSSSILRMVITRRPERYQRKSILGQLEFTRHTPQVLMKKLAARGYKRALLVGGGELNGAFLRAELVHEVWMTIEPILFGQGEAVVCGKLINTHLQLRSVTKLNSRGTLLLKYTVHL